jgi:hypothetical protein
MTGARALGLALSLLLALAFAPASAQQVPDVPTGNATIRGRVVHRSTGAPIEGAEVALYALPAEAPPGLRRATSGPEGRFEFADVDDDPRTTYLVGARHAGVPYPGARVQFTAGETEREIEVRVSDVTGDPSLARLTEVRMRIDWLGGRLQVGENLAFENAGELTVLVPPDARAGSRPIARVGLPNGAGDLSGPLGVVPEGMLRDGDQLAWWGPLLPGAHELEYAYEIAGAPGTASLDRTLPEGVRLTVLAPLGGPRLVAPGLEAGETVSLLGRSYTPWSGEVGATRLALALELPEARVAPDAVSLAEVRIVGELDDAAWAGREEHVLLVEGDAPVIGNEGQPLLVLPLPEGARDMRFGVRESSAALVPAGDGGLAVLGPLAAGETIVDVSYKLPAGEPFVLARHFAAHLPLLSIYVADVGRMGIESDRLHKRRSVRTSDRSYLHLEAFEVAAGERVAFEVTRLPRAARLSPNVGLLAMGAFAITAILFIVSPLRASPETPAARAEAGGARRERDSLYAALADLEHDHETGKVDDTDYATMRADLRGRALELLQQERVASPAAEPAAPEVPAAPTAKATGIRFCRGCGHGVEPEDRFCARCGKRIAPEAPA